MNTVLSAIIDIILLFSFIRALHIYNKYWCRLENDKNINSMQHEQLIIITRYSVVFIICFTVDIIRRLFTVLYAYVIVLKLGYYSQITHYSYTIVVILSNLDTLTYIIAIYCSFEFGYYPYLQLCARCHGFMYKLCEIWTIRQYGKKWNQFKL